MVGACLFFPGLGRLPLLEPDEGRNAEVAREMLSSGDWITPHFDTLPYLDKPAFFFWLVAASFRLWGISEWGARFPSAAMALASMFLTWSLARRMFGAGVGLRAGIILATSPLVIAFSRLVIFDMTFTCLVTLSMLCFWCAEFRDSRPAWFDVLAFAAMGVATITKGPVGFMLPLLSIVAYYAIQRRSRDLKRLHWGLGLIAFLTATLPWFVAVSIRNPDFPRYAFWQESLLRFATSHARRSGSALYYVPVYLMGLFPWSFFLLCAGWNRLRKWREITQQAHKPIAFLLAWAGVIFVFFSISRSKLPAYFLPAAVPLSILMARVWAEVEIGTGFRRPGWLKAGFASLIGLGLVVAAASQLFQLGVVQARIAAKIPASLVSQISLSMLFTGLIVVSLAILGSRLAARVKISRQKMLCFGLLSLTVPMLLVRWIVPLQRYADLASSRQLAMTMLASPEKELPLYGYYYFRTSLPFYLRRPVGLVTADADELTSNFVVYRARELGRQRPLAGLAGTAERRTGYLLGKTGPFGPVLIDAAELSVLSRSTVTPFLVLARNSQVHGLAQTVGRLEPMWNAWEYSVWKVSSSKLETRK